MAPRTAVSRDREYDFSNVGKVGRRTGVVLPQGRVDENGIEEISGLFSSPRKASPLKQMMVLNSIEEIDNNRTPKQAVFVRKSARGASIPPPRSASPRKSGISGTARRSNVIDVFRVHEDGPSSPEEIPELAKSQAPVQLTTRQPAPSNFTAAPQRFSPEKTPLRKHVLERPDTVQIDPKLVFGVQTLGDEDIRQQDEDINNEELVRNGNEEILAQANQLEESFNIPVMDGDDDRISIVDSNPDEPELPAPTVEFDDEEVDQTFQPESKSRTNIKEPTKANSRRKRRSDALETIADADAISSPAAKRAKRLSDEASRARIVLASAASSEPLEEQYSQQMQKQENPRIPLKKKNANSKLSEKQRKDVQGVVDRVRPRPGQSKSLYLLRRETPADDTVTHTRSGRVSVKPLAYWRNERCIYGGSPSQPTLQDGARFPLNSISEIIRTDDIVTEHEKGNKKSKKRGRSKGKKVAQVEELSESENDNGEEFVDQDAEPWETEVGTLRGSVSIWDAEQQAPVEEEEEVDIAYAAAAIQTREVKGSTFRYAKLLSSRFFGTGIVDLPPGAIKRPKNSRRMHMSFFVAKGRVSVEVGALNGSENRFSVGKGGFWQVPRGNQYLIENKHEKPARIFFSQACEIAPLDGDEQ